MQHRLDQLKSLLSPSTYPESAYLSSLKEARGNVKAAATALLNGSIAQGSSGAGRIREDEKSHPGRTREDRGITSGRSGECKGGIERGSRKRRIEAVVEISDSDDDDVTRGRIEITDPIKARLADAISLTSDEETGPAVRALGGVAKRARTRSPVSQDAGSALNPPERVLEPPGATSTTEATAAVPPPAPHSVPPPAQPPPPHPLFTTHLRPSLSSLPPPASIPKRNIPQPPIIVPPYLVTHHLPTCTLEASPLDPKQASALYVALMEEVKGFERPKWYLAGRLVESPHTNAFYRLSEKEGGLKGGGEYFYAGKAEPAPPDFPPLLRSAVKLINPFVNSLLAVRSRCPLEYGDGWQPNVAAVNHYEGAASGVGWHADGLTHLGPCTTIVSLSLGTPRAFRLRPSASLVDPTMDCFGKPLRTYEIVLRHNSLFIMHAMTQEYYKHTVPVQNNKSLDLFKPGWDVDEIPIPPDKIKGYNSRINVTFRMYRKDFHPLAEPIGPMGIPREGTPLCHCRIPCLLRADQKGKVRAGRDAFVGTPTKGSDAAKDNDPRLAHGFGQEMAWFWMCNSGQSTGEMKGCGFFRLLDMRAEGRGPCIGWKDDPDTKQ